MSSFFRGLRTSYRWGEQIRLEIGASSVARVLARDAWGRVTEARRRGREVWWSGLPEGTLSFEVWDGSGQLMEEEFSNIRRNEGEDPVMGFVTSFDAASRDDVLSWLRALRCTVVQVYDWMDSYSVPVSEEEHYLDPLGRTIAVEDLRELIRGIKDIGAVAQAYAPVIAADTDVADSHPQWRLFRNDGVAQSLGELLQIMNPGADGWQRYWWDQYSRALDVLGFNGFHLDTYGYPRAALDDRGNAVDMADAYASFIESIRSLSPEVLMSFNQVNGVPRSLRALAPPSFRYVEVWPPNTRWRHLESLLSRSAGTEEVRGDTLAIYPPVWHLADASALRTVVLSQAIATTLGANVLVWGDRHGVLCHPYYVNHHELDVTLAEEALRWHRFGLRVRDLFKVGVDTSWYELTDENAGVVVSDVLAASPEPVGGSLYVRIRRRVDSIVVSLMDLGGNPEGDWSQGTTGGAPRDVDVVILLEDPAAWSAHVAVLGRHQDLMVAVTGEERMMREGRGVVFRVSLVSGWSVLRLTANGEEQPR